jgi:hypothetical protein
LLPQDWNQKVIDCTPQNDDNELPLEFSRRRRMPRGFWENNINRIAKFDRLAKELNIQKLEDWYNVKQTTIFNKGGRGLLYHFGNSLCDALMASYPNHVWHAWKFGSRTKLHKEEEIHKYVKWLEDKLMIKKLQDWEMVSTARIQKLAPITIVTNHGGLDKLLSRIYPHHNWATIEPRKASLLESGQ